MAKILVVDDDPVNVNIVTRLLALHGHETTSASDGAAALEAARAQAPQLILMDMKLPKLDGWEATRRLKADPATRAIPVIAFTAQAMPGDDARTRECGCDDYDSKPIDFERLYAKIVRLLGDG